MNVKTRLRHTGCLPSYYSKPVRAAELNRQSPRDAEGASVRVLWTEKLADSSPSLASRRSGRHRVGEAETAGRAPSVEYAGPRRRGVRCSCSALLTAVDNKRSWDSVKLAKIRKRRAKLACMRPRARAVGRDCDNIWRTRITKPFGK